MFISNKALTSFRWDNKLYVAKTTKQDFIGYVEYIIDANRKEEPLKDAYSPQSFNSLDIWNSMNYDYKKSFKEIEKATNYTASGAIDFPEDITKLPICTKCGEPTIRCYCGKACICLCDNQTTGCQHRRFYSGISVPIFNMDFETKKIGFVNYIANDNKHNRKIDLYLLKAYQIKFGRDERVISFENAAGQFFELTEHLEYYYENIAKTGNLNKLNALKTINKVGTVFTVGTMLSNFADANYESAFETVIDFIPYASQFKSFLEFTDSKIFLTSMKNASLRELNNLYDNYDTKNEYINKCINDNRKIFDYCNKRLNDKAYFEELDYHNEHCTCFKK